MGSIPVFWAASRPSPSSKATNSFGVILKRLDASRKHSRSGFGLKGSSAVIIVSNNLRIPIIFNQKLLLEDNWIATFYKLFWHIF